MPTITFIRGRVKLNYPGLTMDEIRAIHYSRNDNQAAEITYLDVISGDYKLVSDAKSSLHRLSLGTNSGNAHNSKWESADGHTEYVFRYSYGEGQFEMVTSPLKSGDLQFRAGHQKRACLVGT